MTTSSSSPLSIQALASRCLGILERLRAPFERSANAQDRERMRDVNAQALTASDALLLTDYSPVSFVSCERCRCDEGGE